MSRPLRRLQLLQALRGQGLPVTAARLAHRLGVSERTIYRDVADLLAQGVPIEGEAGVGYTLPPGLFLPPLLLSQSEVDAVIEGLHRLDRRTDADLGCAARTALAKFHAILPPNL